MGLLWISILSKGRSVEPGGGACKEDRSIDGERFLPARC